MEVCKDCQKSFASKNSLYSHKSRYHKAKDKTSNNNYEKHSQSHPAFGYDINRTKKRYLNDEELFEESDIENEPHVKRSKSEDVNETSQGDKKVKTLEEKIEKLFSVVAGLVRNTQAVPTEFHKVREDVDDIYEDIGNIKERIRNQNFLKNMKGSGKDKELENYYHKYTAQLHTLFNQFIEVQEDVEGMKESGMDKELENYYRKYTEQLPTLFEQFVEV